MSTQNGTSTSSAGHVTAGHVTAGQVAAGLLRYAKASNYALYLFLVVGCVGIASMNIPALQRTSFLIVVSMIIIMAIIALWVQKRSPIRARRDDAALNHGARSFTGAAGTKEQVAYFTLFLTPMLSNFLRDMFGPIPSVAITIPLFLFSGWYIFIRESSDFMAAKPHTISATDPMDPTPRARIMGALECAGVLGDSATSKYDFLPFTQAPDYVPGVVIMFVDMLPQATALGADEVRDELRRLEREQIVTIRTYSEGLTKSVRNREVVEAYI